MQLTKVLGERERTAIFCLTNAWSILVSFKSAFKLRRKEQEELAAKESGGAALKGVGSTGTLESQTQTSTPPIKIDAAA